VCRVGRAHVCVCVACVCVCVCVCVMCLWIQSSPPEAITGKYTEVLFITNTREGDPKHGLNIICAVVPRHSAETIEIIRETDRQAGRQTRQAGRQTNRQTGQKGPRCQPVLPHSETFLHFPHSLTFSVSACFMHGLMRSNRSAPSLPGGHIPLPHVISGTSQQVHLTVVPLSKAGVHPILHLRT